MSRGFPLKAPGAVTEATMGMGAKNSPRLRRFLPQVILATTAVMVVPILSVWMVRASGAITSMIPLILLGTAISLVLGWVGRWIWETRRGSGDLLFGELMVWGFVRRWRNERRLRSAATLLGLNGKVKAVDAKDHSPEEQAELLEQLAESLEARDTYTSGHSRRVARHAAMIAKRMGLPEAEVARIRTAGVLHDVGKIDTPTKVLNKESRLTDDEFDEIKKHPVRGAEMMRESHFDAQLVTIVAHHHERLDGKGYPDGLKGKNIPLGSRIIAVADTFDALTSARPYRGAKPHKRALKILNEESGTQLDPDAVRAFTSHYSGFRPIAVWAFFTGLPQRVFYPLFGESAAGGAISAAKVMAATAAAVGAGSAVAANAPVVDKPWNSQANAAVSSTVAGRQGEGHGAGADPRDTHVAGGGKGGGSKQGSAHSPSSSRGQGHSGASAPGDADNSTDPADPADGSTTDPVEPSDSKPVKPTGGNSGSGNSGSGNSGSGNSGNAPGHNKPSGSGGSGGGNGNSGSAPGHNKPASGGGSGGGGGNSGSGGGNSGGGSGGSGGSGSGGSGSGGSGGSGGGGSSSSGGSGGGNSGSGGGGSKPKAAPVAQG